MKQIKTIKRQLDASAEFDKEVNAALENGWRLLRREVLPPYEGEERIFFRMLYAELERDDYVPASASCDTCTHSVDGAPSDSLHSICRHCKGCKHWEPQLKKGEKA